MALLENALVVKRSTIPASGKGLFTKVFIPKGTRIIEYKGKISTWKEVDHDDGKNGYIYYVNRNFVIDASSDKKALARYANDAKGLKRIKGINNNSIYRQDNLRVFIEASKDIPANSEIFVRYGKEYWDVVRHNAKLAAKELREKQRKAVKRKKTRN